MPWQAGNATAQHPHDATFSGRSLAVAPPPHWRSFTVPNHTRVCPSRPASPSARPCRPGGATHLGRNAVDVYPHSTSYDRIWRNVHLPSVDGGLPRQTRESFRRVDRGGRQTTVGAMLKTSSPSAPGGRGGLVDGASRCWRSTVPQKADRSRSPKATEPMGWCRRVRFLDAVLRTGARHSWALSAREVARRQSRADLAGALVGS